MEPLKLNIHDIIETTRECRSVIFEAIKAGHLKTFKVGRRHFARPAEVARWVDYLEAQSRKGKPAAYRPEVTDREPVSNKESSARAVAARRAKGADHGR